MIKNYSINKIDRFTKYGQFSWLADAFLVLIGSHANKVVRVVARSCQDQETKVIWKFVPRRIRIGYYFFVILKPVDSWRWFATFF